MSKAEFLQIGRSDFITKSLLRVSPKVTDVSTGKLKIEKNNFSSFECIVIAPPRHPSEDYIHLFKSVLKSLESEEVKIILISSLACRMNHIDDPEYAHYRERKILLECIFRGTLGVEEGFRNRVIIRPAMFVEYDMLKKSFYIKIFSHVFRVFASAEKSFFFTNNHTLSESFEVVQNNFFDHYIIESAKELPGKGLVSPPLFLKKILNKIFI